MRIAAIVPMRHSSERVSRKNYRLFANKPLFYHVVESLLACPEIDEIVIDTDSETIKGEVEKSFPGIRVIERPEHLRDGTVPMNDVLMNTTAILEADYFLQTHSTNPLLKADTISGAVQCLLENRNRYDSLFSVKRL